MNAILNSIIFKFVQDVTNTNFSNKLDWGFELKVQTEDSSQPRWGKVICVGPDVKNVKANDYILIEPLMWTNYVDVGDGNKVWKTNENKVMVSTSEYIQGIY